MSWIAPPEPVIVFAPVAFVIQSVWTALEVLDVTVTVSVAVSPVGMEQIANARTALNPVPMEEPAHVMELANVPLGLLATVSVNVKRVPIHVWIILIRQLAHVMELAFVNLALLDPIVNVWFPFLEHVLMERVVMIVLLEIAFAIRDGKDLFAIVRPLVPPCVQTMEPVNVMELVTVILDGMEPMIVLVRET
jgi:hypothetical protein